MTSHYSSGQLALILAAAALIGPHGVAFAQESTGSPIVLDTIVINANRSGETGYLASTTIGRIAAEPKDVPATVSSITADRIQDQDLRSDLDVLEATPGVDVTSNEGFFSIRGYYGGVAVDGIPVDTFIGRTSSDLSPFENVEVLKGPAAIFQGVYGLGGVVNYSMKRPGSVEGGEVRVGLGDPSSKRLMLDYTVKPALDGRLRSRFVGSYEDRDLDTKPEGYKRLSLYGVTEFDATERATLRFSAWRQRNNSVQSFRDGLPAYTDGTLIDFPLDTTTTQDWALYRFRSEWLTAEIEYEFNDRWTGRLSYRQGDSHHPSMRNVSGLCEGNDKDLGYSRGSTATTRMGANVMHCPTGTTGISWAYLMRT
ncbi:MAG: hypothetical protein DI498_00675 [Paracoccus denitrificans]|nr:MAG: hypothetical protein DI498_00675 [Paracoccus denitrificans]PZO86281.1 MAG: hypothetical protein DI633_00675 [Paracoccus denitrificans]